ncbi:MAG TPA: outer membrane protein assembly factor BamE [Ignavibacteriaceae bacterium]|nr:outer membrane protein assembly factor BamE [Ignavibacteriaceae bacterium]
MKIKLLMLLFILILFLIFGCSASQNSINVNPGMNKDNVLSIMGTPGNRQFNGAREAWQYCSLKLDREENEYTVIWFNEGKVSGMTTYRYGNAYGEYAKIDWNIAPEIRIRRIPPVHRHEIR